MTNPCENCPDRLLYTVASRELSHLQNECNRARQEITSPDTSRKRRRYLASRIASMGRSLIPFHEGLLPEGGEEAVSECVAPFERVRIDQSEEDGIRRQYLERVCGARIANHVTGALITPEEA